MGKLADNLGTLNAAVADAAAARDEARQQATDYHVERESAEAAAPLAKYWRQHGAGTVGDVHGEHRQAVEDMTAELVRRVQEDGLILLPVNPAFPAAGVRVYDPSRRDALADAEATLAEARADLATFKSKNADALRAERDAEEHQRLRDAIDSADPAALRDALATA